MPTNADDITVSAQPLTYHGIAVTPVPGHDGVFASARGLAAFRSLPPFAHGLLLGWALIPGGRSTSGGSLVILGSGALDGGVSGALILAVDEEQQP
jgi:hypothetical protein